MTKQSLDDLALFGGKPSFEQQIFVGRPNIGNKEDLLKGLGEILDRRWLTNNGQLVQNLEQRIADLLGVKHCIMVCNATIALELTIRALDMTGEVIVPSWTFIATAHSLQWQGISPVFCDVDPRSHNLDPAQVEKMITPRTTGIIGVHLWGRACPVEALADIAERNNLQLMYDASHAFACSYDGRMIGSFGKAEVFSFHATKFLNCFEGGAVTTNDDELAEKLRLMRNFGFAGFDNVIYIGTNGKMSEVSALMGLVGLDHMHEFIGRNEENYKLYREELSGLDGISLIPFDETEKNNFQYVVLEVDEEGTGIHRDVLMEILHSENVVARRYFYPGCHRMEPYRSFFPHAGLLLPHTENLAQRVLSLPTGTAVDKDMVREICAILRFALQHAEPINRRTGDSKVTRIDKSGQRSPRKASANR